MHILRVKNRDRKEKGWCWVARNEDQWFANTHKGYTSNMTPRQLQDHKFLCGVIRDKYGVNWYYYYYMCVRSFLA
jgi:hypothetical protein